MTATSPSRARTGRRQGAAEPSLRLHLIDGHHPRLVAVGRSGQDGQPIDRTGIIRSGVQPAEPGLATQHDRLLRQPLVDRCGPRSHLDLAVVGGHGQHRPTRQHLEQVSHHAVHGDQLGVVIGSEAAYVGDLVDPLVVGVDERLPCGQQAPHLDRQARRHRPPATGASRWWACVKPVPTNSFLLTTGTGWPWNGGRG